MLARIAQSLYRRFLGPRVEAWFFRDLIEKTENFSHVTWLGTPVWQNVLAAARRLPGHYHARQAKA
jgi:hypothetical protein